MGRPKKLVQVKDENSTSTMVREGAIIEEETPTIRKTREIIREKFTYPIPETREDLLALHKCLKDLGVNSTSDLEVRASRM